MKKPTECEQTAPRPTSDSPPSKSCNLAARGIVVLSLFAAAAETVGGADGSRQPNVIMVISDDLNCDVGCYGGTRLQTPNIDRLAAKGVRFDRAYVQYTVCNPSRTSFLTGLRPETTGVTSNEIPFRAKLPDAVTLPELFRRNGYVTAGLGKVFHRGLSPDEVRAERDDARSWNRTFYGKATETGNRGQGRNMSGGKLPWCRWVAADGGEEDQADGQIASEAIRFIDEHQDSPFFLAVGFYRPHDPFQSPAKYFDLYPLKTLDPPTEPVERTTYLRHAIPGGPFGNAFGAFADRDKREFLRAYYAGATFMDAQLGRILDALDKWKRWDSTIVVFLGDHGYELGVRNWWGKNTLYERSCRTPLILWSPGAAGMGKACSSLVEFVDLYPTLADLCGLKPPANLEGESFRRLLDDPTKPGKAAARTMVVRGPNVIGRSVRTNRYRFTEWNEAREGAELYDHETDPGEWINRIDDASQSDVVRRLRVLLRDGRD